MVVVCVVSYVVVLAAASLDAALALGTCGVDVGEHESGGAGTEWAIGVLEHAGIGTKDADDAKPTDVFATEFGTHFCAITP